MLQWHFSTSFKNTNCCGLVGGYKIMSCKWLGMYRWANGHNYNCDHRTTGLFEDVQNTMLKWQVNSVKSANKAKNSVLMARKWSIYDYHQGQENHFHINVMSSLAWLWLTIFCGDSHLHANHMAMADIYHQWEIYITSIWLRVKCI
jgi:hypothetical protein